MSGKPILNPTGVVKQSNMDYKEDIDISHHNEIDWSQLTLDKSGKKFIIAKATEGATYQGPMFVKNFRNAYAAGFQPGAYYFFRFGSSPASDQMKNFVSQIEKAVALADLTKSDSTKTIIALDIQEHKGGDYTLVRSVTEESIQYLRDKANITTYIYTRTSFWNEYVS